ncbi:MAG: 5-formyltetrahydrofolate cyclo-ligase, partial [Pseudoclavibacter sp.]
GGFYDRALAQLRPVAGKGHGAAPIITIVFDDEVRGDLPLEPHDMPVDGVLTPSGVRWFGSSVADAGADADER